MNKRYNVSFREYDDMESVYDDQINSTSVYGVKKFIEETTNSFGDTFDEHTLNEELCKDCDRLQYVNGAGTFYIEVC